MTSPGLSVGTLSAWPIRGHPVPARRQRPLKRPLSHRRRCRKGEPQGRRARPLALAGLDVRRPTPGASNSFTPPPASVTTRCPSAGQLHQGPGLTGVASRSPGSTSVQAAAAGGRVGLGGDRGGGLLAEADVGAGAGQVKGQRASCVTSCACSPRALLARRQLEIPIGPTRTPLTAVSVPIHFPSSLACRAIVGRVVVGDIARSNSLCVSAPPAVSMRLHASPS